MESVGKSSRENSRFSRVGGLLLGTIAAVGVVAGAWWWLSGSAPPPVRTEARRPASAPKPAAPPPTVPGSATPIPAPPAPAAGIAGGAATRAAAVPAASGGTDRYRNALEVFGAGDLDGAAAIWEALLAEEHHPDFTLLLMTACAGDTVRNAQRALAPQPLYLVAKQVSGRGCFRVCLGTYASREEAGRALAALPEEFRSAGAAVRPVAAVLARDGPQR